MVLNITNIKIAQKEIFIKNYSIDFNDEEQEKLRKAQRGWLQFHTQEPEFVHEAWNDLGFGSQGKNSKQNSSTNGVLLYTRWRSKISL